MYTCWLLSFSVMWFCDSFMFLLSTLDCCWVVFLWMAIAWFISSLVDLPFGYFQLLLIWIKQVFVWIYDFISLGWLDSKEIKPVNSKGNQSWIFIGRTDVEDEAPILWLPDAKSWLIGNDPNAEIDWGQKEKRVTRMRWLDSIIDSMDKNLSKIWEIVKEGSLACCSSWGRQESDMT